MAFRTLVVGLGRAGAGLHVPVVRAARRLSPLFDTAPVLGYDPVGGTAPAGAALVRSLAEAADTADPGRTVVHLCTPPTVRAGALAELAGLGYRMVLVEKPLATDDAGVADVLRVRDEHGLDLVVVSQWLASELTARLAALVADERYGALRGLTITQNKPRFARSAGGDGHPTAFDVEMPHGLGVALRLAGPAEVAGADGDDLRFADVCVPRMGRAWLSLRHASGTATELCSDLAAPIRERSITAAFEQATVTGHYPVSETDEYAQLFTTVSGRTERVVFRDPSLTTFTVGAYEHFAGRRTLADVDLNAEVVRLLGIGKGLAAGPVVAHA